MIYYDDDYATNGICERAISGVHILLLTCICLDLKKHFWAYKHFGNFVKRAQLAFLFFSSHLTISNPFRSRRPPPHHHQQFLPLLNSTIFVGTPSGDAFNVISMNPTTEDVQLELSFSTCVEPTAAYRTSAEEDFAEIEAADVVTAGEEGWTGRGWRTIGVLVVSSESTIHENTR